MARLLTLLIFCSWSAAAQAGEATSVYSKFDLDHCKVIEAGDEYVYESTWACEGFDGIDIYIAGSDDRNSAAFGRDATGHCAFRKTFGPSNTSLSPVEWRVKDGKVFAAIERWSVVNDDSGHSVTWLVVNALRESESCHVHYVAGSFPHANGKAREIADTLAAGFDCENGIPGFSSTLGAPPIDLAACKDLARE